jgi:hypothetical protein
MQLCRQVSARVTQTTFLIMQKKISHVENSDDVLHQTLSFNGVLRLKLSINNCQSSKNANFDETLAPTATWDRCCDF